MKFCTKCIMPDTRPGITFDGGGMYCLPEQCAQEGSGLGRPYGRTKGFMR